MPTHGFSSRLQQRYASTTAQGGAPVQQNAKVRPGVYHRGVNKLTSLATPSLSTSATPSSGIGNRSGRSVPLPVQTSSLRKENGGQDVTAVLVNRGGGKKVGWGSSVPAPAPAAAPSAASLGPTPADVAAKEAAEKEKASKAAAPLQPEPVAQEHPPLPPAPAPENKNIPWALHPPSQPSATSLGALPPHSGDRLRPEEIGGPPRRDDYRDRGRFESRGGGGGGYPPHDRYGGGGGGGGGGSYDHGGSRYGDYRRYSDGPYDERPRYDERRYYRDRDYNTRGSGSYYRDRDRDRDRGYYRNEYRGSGGGSSGYHRGEYERERDYDYRMGGSYQDRGRYRGGSEDRRWNDYDRSTHQDGYYSRDGPVRPRSYDRNPYDGRAEDFRRRSVEPEPVPVSAPEPSPVRFQEVGPLEPPPSLPQMQEVRGEDAGGDSKEVPNEVEDATNTPPIQEGKGPSGIVREEAQQQLQLPPLPPVRSNPHQVPVKCEVDAAFEAVRAREEAEERARRRKEEAANVPERTVEEKPGYSQQGQRPSEDAGAWGPPGATAREPISILQNNENQSSGEASGDATAAETKTTVWVREPKRVESVSSGSNTHSNGNGSEVQQLEKIGALRQSALVTNNAGQDSADVRPRVMLRQHVDKPKAQELHDKKQLTEEHDIPDESHIHGGDDEQPESKTHDTDSTESHESSAKEPERELIIFEECQTEEELRQKQQQIILQQVAAARNKKEKLRRKEKKSTSNSAPQIVARAKDADDGNGQKATNKEKSEEAMDTKPEKVKRKRNRRPRTRGVLFKKMQDGTIVNADLSEEQIESIKKNEQLKKEKQAQQQKQQQQRREEKAALEKASKETALKKVGPSSGKVEEQKTPPPNKSPKEIVPAPPPAVSAWKQGPPPSIVKSSPSLTPQNIGSNPGKSPPPDTSLLHHNCVETDEWAPTADFPKLGPGRNGMEKETASWIPPPVDLSDTKQEKRVIAAPLIMDNVGSWNFGVPISAAAADWSVGQTRVNTDWTPSGPSPVMDEQDDDTAHLSDGSGAVPRDLLSSAPESEDEDGNSGDEKKQSSATGNIQAKRSRRGRSRRGGRGRSRQKNNQGENLAKNEGDKGDAVKQKKSSSSRRGKRPQRSHGKKVGITDAGSKEATKSHHGGGFSNQGAPKPPRQDASTQRKSYHDTKSSGKKSNGKQPVPHKTTEAKKRSRRPPKNRDAPRT